MDRTRLLPGRYVALDFETTGLRPGQDRIIDIGAVEWVDGAPGARLSLLVNPGIPVPPHVVQLTRIRDADVAAAPTLAEVLPTLVAFLDDAPVLAHNAAFERAFLAQALGAPPANRFLDTLELAALVRAADRRRSLDHLARELRVRETEVHRGLEDALDCLEVGVLLLETLLREGRRGFVERALDVMAGIEWPWRREFEHLLALFPSGGDARAAVAPRPRVQRDAEPEDYAPVSAEEVRAVFAPEGPLARATARVAAAGEGGAPVAWEPRAGQVRMAEAVAEALSTGRSLLVEAPTGTGKSLAYLVPAALFAKRNGVQVLVATHTRNLQDQLAGKDVPRAVAAVGGGLTSCVVKGQENYLCKRRTERWLADGPALTESLEERSVRLYAAAFTEQSVDGDLEGFVPWQAVQGPHVRRALAQIRSTAETCLHQRCPHYHGCFYQAVVHGSRTADLLVTNHALALRWPERYGRPRHVVLDEAHALEDAATSAFARRVEPDAIRLRILETAGDGAASGRIGAAVRALARRTADGGPTVAAWPERGERLRAELVSLAHDVDAFESAAVALVEAAGRDEGDYARKNLRLVPTLGGTPSYEAVRSAAGRLHERLTAAARGLGGLVDALAERDPHDPLARELVAAAEALGEDAALLHEIATELEGGLVYWIEVEHRRGGRRLAVQAAPVDVAPGLAEALYRKHRSVILTSATLKVGLEAGDGYVARRIGYDRIPPAEREDLLEIPSPFDLPSQLVVAVPEDVADASDGHRFVRDVARVVVEAARLLGGRMLVLFAANSRRDQVAQLVHEPLAAAGIELLNQGAGMGRDRIVRELRDGGRKVVLGSRSFWEGVDVPGDALSCVVIEKLPFDFPWDPVHQAREEAIRRVGGSPFDEYSLPKALLRYRQGVGRLVRTATDRGVVLLLQSSVLRRSYRSRVEESLPGVRILSGPWSEIATELDRYVEMG